ncbi:hypothetical protein KR032_000088 [Drosophila birchii]|nr:hypothetical protein KR032_000088 [Drosophila birchii]
MMGNIIGGQTVSEEIITAYNNFLCTYGLLHAEMLPNDAIQHATYMWCNLSPEQQMDYARMYPGHPRSFPYNVRSEYVQPQHKFSLPPKAKLKVKTPAQKCRTKIKPTIAKKRKPVAKGVKTKANPRRESPKTGFQQFYKTLRNQHSEITEQEIVKKAARAWCNMSPEQRYNFLR